MVPTRTAEEYKSLGLSLLDEAQHTADPVAVSYTHLTLPTIYSV